MIVDLHAHTHYSWCGDDSPKALVDEMVRQGVEVLGINDHRRGIADREEAYLAEVATLRKAYAGQITLLCGVEICTLPQWCPDSQKRFQQYDYCLVENLADEQSVMDGDLLGFTKAYQCRVGIAHTDLFDFIKKRGLDARSYLQSLADRGVFWELNVNYDSIHGYREHAYVKQFMQDEAQQALVRETGLFVSIGFDGHRLKDYAVERVVAGNDFLQKAGIRNAVQLFLG